MIKRSMTGLILVLLALPYGLYAKPAPGPLVDTAWLASNMNDVVILDIRANTKSFTAKPAFKTDKKSGKQKLVRVGGHIPGARMVDYKKVRAKQTINGKQVDKMLPDKASFEALMQSVGANKDSTIIIVSRGQNSHDMTMATRLYWQLKYFGHDNMAILNGGTAQWIKDGHKVSSKPVKPTKGNWVATAERKDILATSDDVAKATQDKSAQLIDARTIDLYLGTWRKGYVYEKGHIPGAKYLPHVTLTEHGMGAKILPVEELQQLATAMGVDSSQPAITYCNSGHLASGSWFVMHELMGNKNVKLYDGSMHEWTLEKRPVKAMVME
ncbi:MAG: sulfurtransferase [Proteobacteria bacterium]|nr:sulfurtransferase [Pseudomonadota bacterium]